MFVENISPLKTRRPTKRAADVWDSARFSSIFLASSFFASRSESQPAHTRLTQTVRRLTHSPNKSEK